MTQARERRWRVVEPSDVYANQLATQFKTITNNELPPQLLVLAASE